MAGLIMHDIELMEEKANIERKGVEAKKNE